MKTFVEKVMRARTEPIPAGGTDRKRLSGPALRTFFRIADLWVLSVDEQMTLLGLTAKSTFYKWKKNPDVVLPRDTLERISYVVGIYKALQILLPDKRGRMAGYGSRTRPRPSAGGPRSSG